MRFFPSLVVALLLLLGQQGGATHALRHVLAEQSQQQNKKTQHTNDCEQCISYAQLGSALNSHFLTLALLTSLKQTLSQHHTEFFTLHLVPATARGPPTSPSIT